MTITIEFSAQPGSVTLVVAGELDAVGAPPLAAALDTAFVTALDTALVDRHDRPPRLTIDSTAVTFCSAAGLTVLLDATARAHRVGVAFELDPCSRAIARVAELAGLLALLPASSQTPHPPHPPQVPRLPRPSGDAPARAGERAPPRNAT